MLGSIRFRRKDGGAYRLRRGTVGPGGVGARLIVYVPVPGLARTVGWRVASASTSGVRFAGGATITVRTGNVKSSWRAASAEGRQV